MPAPFTPADVAQMVADACGDCLAGVDWFIEAEWTAEGELVLTLSNAGNLYRAAARFAVAGPFPAND